MSRGQSGPSGLVDLHAAVAAVTRLIEPTARAHGIQVETPDISTGLLVRADEAEMHNVLVNLLLNAVQASPRGACVVVSALAGDDIRLRVKDHGCGIAPDNLKRIFEPFFSLRGGGTGLGLFLSLNSVRRWGGDIRVDSAPGQGSTFEVSLPALAIAAEQGSGA
jgi:signal transduction histidine kinase